MADLGEATNDPSVLPPPASLEAEKSHRFNDDLLLDEVDRIRADELYPVVSYALSYQTLRERFQAVDPLANTAKRRSRKSGLWAVMLVTFALICAAAQPLYEGQDQIAFPIATIAALTSLVGVLIGSFGVLYARPKRGWLRHRLLTEQMRLFHFRTMLTLAHLILTRQAGEFVERRASMFSEFESDILQRPGIALETVLETDLVGDRLTPVMPPLPTSIDPAAQEQFLRAYRRLRIQRQIDYAQYKLRRDGKLFSAFPRQQGIWLERAGVFCIVGTVAAHILVVLHIFLGEGAAIGSWVHVVGIWFAIAALAMKTLQEGLQPKLEVERYRHYRAAVQAAADRFDTAESLGDKLAAAMAVERARADEMVIFLRSSSESRFVM